jgi:hypothetical protein
MGPHSRTTESVIPVGGVTRGSVPLVKATATLNCAAATYMAAVAATMIAART